MKIINGSTLEVIVEFQKSDTNKILDDYRKLYPDVSVDLSGDIVVYED